MLDVLAAQAAISLENAGLYSELRESEVKYSRIVSTAAEGIWVLDPEGNTVFVNDKMAEMLGCPAREMVGRPVSDFMFEEDASDHLRRMESAGKEYRSTSNAVSGTRTAIQCGPWIRSANLRRSASVQGRFWNAHRHNRAQTC